MHCIILTAVMIRFTLSDRKYIYIYHDVVMNPSVVIKITETQQQSMSE